MALAIEDYALVGDTHTAALVGLDGSIDWLCFPRFDSAACFSALLGTPDNGRWLLAPQAEPRTTRRRYLPGTLVLETEFDTADGTVRVVDFMPHREHEGDTDNADVVRIVEGVSGRVPMRMELIVRFDYGWIVPWVRHVDDCLHAVGGPDALALTTPLDVRGEGLTTVAEFTVGEGDRIPLNLTWHPSHLDIPTPRDAEGLLAETTDWWRSWSRRCAYEGPWEEAVTRSLVTLKGLTYEPTGGIVAAPTTSLPEHVGGVRNWDYRYCWLRDATFTLDALLLGGYRAEAVAWRDWLLRAAAGDPRDLQILYGPAGERRIAEIELGWLGGYEQSRPVRVGNAAVDQFQLDVFGEVMDAMHEAREAGIEPEEEAWELQRALLEHLESDWREPDEGLWEVRGPRRHFTHSKVMAWVAADRAVKAVETHGLDGPAARWRRLRDAIHAEVCDRGFDPDRGAFTQYYGSETLDAALLMVPLVGFLPVDDARVVGTVDAVEKELCVDRFVMRYTPAPEVDGLPGEEGAFLLTTFWLVQVQALQGRTEEAATLFEHLLGIRNDVGLLAEEYDPGAERQLGNFPQAFSHVGLVNAACALTDVRDIDRRGSGR